MTPGRAGAATRAGRRQRAAAAIAAAVEGGLRRHADPVRAAGAKRYLKSDLEFIGVTTPQLRAVVTESVRRGPGLSRAELIAACAALWARPVFELKAAAVELLTGRATLLAARDLRLVERMVRESATWALVDALAVHVAGTLVEREPRLLAALDRWSRDRDFWVRRAAMLALLLPLRRGGGEFERFASYAEAMLGEREFFIRKAIGWVLREVGKKRPQLVTAWLAPRVERASGVTFREAVRRLPPRDRARLEKLRARRTGP